MGGVCYFCSFFYKSAGVCCVVYKQSMPVSPRKMSYGECHILGMSVCVLGKPHRGGAVS